MNEWLAAASKAELMHGALACRLSITVGPIVLHEYLPTERLSISEAGKSDISRPPTCPMGGMLESFLRRRPKRRRYNRKHLPMPAVEQQRLLSINQELVECEAGPLLRPRQKGRHAIDTITNLFGPDIHVSHL